MKHCRRSPLVFLAFGVVCGILAFCLSVPRVAEQATYPVIIEDGQPVFPDGTPEGLADAFLTQLALLSLTDDPETSFHEAYSCTDLYYIRYHSLLGKDSECYFLPLLTFTVIDTPHAGTSAPWKSSLLVAGVQVQGDSMKTVEAEITDCDLTMSTSGSTGFADLLMTEEAVTVIGDTIPSDDKRLSIDIKRSSATFSLQKITAPAVDFSVSTVAWDDGSGVYNVPATVEARWNYLIKYQLTDICGVSGQIVSVDYLSNCRD